MSFSPAELDGPALEQLAGAFEHALRKATEVPRTSADSRALLMHALGRQDEASERARAIGAMRFKAGRQRLWRLLEAQIRAGITLYEALGYLKKDREKLGFPAGFDSVLDGWRALMEQGQPGEEFFLRYLLPVDFNEAVSLTLTARLGSVRDAIQVAAEHR